jgi:hypothetical protein
LSHLAELILIGPDKVRFEALGQSKRSSSSKCILLKDADFLIQKSSKEGKMFAKIKTFRT